MDAERAHLQRMIKMLLGNLNTYQEQAAAFGELYVPPFLKRQIEETSEELEQAKERLAQLQPLSPVGQRPLSSVPHNLPPRVDLIGRVEERSKILQALRSQVQAVLIGGMVGIGKTALATKIAHEFWDSHSYQAIVWMSLEDQSLVRSSIFDMIGYVLDNQYLMRLPAEDKPLAALNLLQLQHTLLVVDGFDQIEDPQVKWFLNHIPAPSGCLAVSNRIGAQLDYAYSLTLRGLNPDESVKLIYREGDRLNIPGIGKAPEALLLELHDVTSGNPYALKLSIGQLRFGQSLDSIISRLKAAQGPVFDDIYAKTWDLLEQESRSLLMTMTVFGGSVSQQALASVSGMKKTGLENSLVQLTDMSLIDTNGELEEKKIRYSILPLTRSFAARKLQEIDQEAKQLKLAVADYMEAYCEKYKEDFPSLQLELDNFRTVTKWYSQYLPQKHIKLARLLYPFYRDCGYWEDAIWHNQSAIDLVEGQEDYQEERAWLLCQQASIYVRRGSQQELQKANEMLSEAEAIFGRFGNDIGMCAALGRQARVAQKQKRFEEALGIAKRALDIASRLKLISRMADIHHELADTYLLMDELDLAQKHYEESLDLFKQLGDSVRITGRVNDLGNIARQKGEWAKAQDLYQQSVQLANQLNKKDTLCRALNGLALVEEEMGFLIDAFRHAKQAEVIAGRLGAQTENKQANETIDRTTKLLQDSYVFIFDFDNTLADSISLHIEAWTLASRHFGYNLSALKLQHALEKGLPSEEVAAELEIDSEHVEGIIRLKRSLFRDDALGELEFFPEVPAVLSELKSRGHVLAIASLNSEIVIQEVLSRAGLNQYFIEIVGQESTTKKQPDPQIINLLLKRIPVPKSNFVLVGDSPNDYELARRAGIRFIHCQRTQTTLPLENFEKSWAQVTELSQILGIKL